MSELDVWCVTRCSWSGTAQLWCIVRSSHLPFGNVTRARGCTATKLHDPEKHAG